MEYAYKDTTFNTLNELDESNMDEWPVEKLIEAAKLYCTVYESSLPSSTDEELVKAAKKMFHVAQMVMNQFFVQLKIKVVGEEKLTQVCDFVAEHDDLFCRGWRSAKEFKEFFEFNTGLSEEHFREAISCFESFIDASKEMPEANKLLLRKMILENSSLDIIDMNRSLFSQSV